MGQGRCDGRHVLGQLRGGRGCDAERERFERRQLGGDWGHGAALGCYPNGLELENWNPQAVPSNGDYTRPKKFEDRGAWVGPLGAKTAAMWGDGRGNAVALCHGNRHGRRRGMPSCSLLGHDMNSGAV